MAWTSDGYALAVGYLKGWAVWSVSGRLGGWGLAESNIDNQEAREAFMNGVLDLVSRAGWLRADGQFWAAGNMELFVASRRKLDSEFLFKVRS